MRVSATPRPPLRKKRGFAPPDFQAAALERIVPGKLPPASTLPLCRGIAGASATSPCQWRQNRHLRVEFRIIPVGPRYRRPQVVNDRVRGTPPEVTKRIFQTPDEALGRLLPVQLHNALREWGEDKPKQMRSLAFAVYQHPRTLPKIHLGFLSRFHFHPHKRHWLCLEQLRTKRCTE